MVKSSFETSNGATWNLLRLVTVVSSLVRRDGEGEGEEKEEERKKRRERKERLVQEHPATCLSLYSAFQQPPHPPNSHLRAISWSLALQQCSIDAHGMQRKPIHGSR